MMPPDREPLHRTARNSYGRIISQMQGGVAAGVGTEGQEPLYKTIRNSYERITSHMEMQGVPSGWPAVPPPKISGHVDCVIQYVDMSGSTRLALDTDPDRYALLVTAFCREVAQIVRQHGGFPLKYVGDAVMSVYTGYSLYAADSTLGAAVSIMRMMHHAYAPATGMRIDAHSTMSYGRVVAIPQGEGVDILGAPVNLAAKMLALGRPVVMDGRFRERLHPEYEDIRELEDSGWQYGGELYEYTGGFHG